MLKVQGLRAGYGDVNVLKDVSIDVPTGSATAVLGPNGAGKTTLLRSISGLNRPTAGKVALDDVDITSQPSYQLARRGLCHVGEGRAIFHSLTVGENLRLFTSKDDTDRLIESAVASFPVLGRRMRQLAGTMSGGEQQMLALCRTHRLGVKLALLDEVSMGLAPLYVEAIFEFLASLVKSGISMMLVEQYTGRALQMVETASILNRGSLVFSGKPNELADGEIFERYLNPARTSQTQQESKPQTSQS